MYYPTCASSIRTVAIEEIAQNARVPAETLVCTNRETLKAAKLIMFLDYFLRSAASPEKGLMAFQKLCACDRTHEKLIGARLDLVNTVSMRFPELVKILSDVPKSGLWLNHFRGIPRGPRLSRFDVIYLDESARVLECVENFTEAEFEPLEKAAESALILPAHTLASLRVQPGDQLRICEAGKIVVGGPASKDEQCIRDVVLNVAPKETKRQIPDKAVVSIAQDSKLTLKERFFRWLFPEAETSDRRNGVRMPGQDLVAYYWTGGSPLSYKIGNISRSGLFLFTEERWLPGTRLMMTLQKAGADAAGPEEISRVESEVIRWGEDGIGCQFVESSFIDLNSRKIVEGRIFASETFDRFLNGVTGPNQL